MFHCLLFNVHNLGFRRPAGPYRIATILRQEGWDSEVVEFANDWTLDQLKELCRSRINANTKFIGYGVMFDMWDNPGTMEDFSVWFKKEYPHIPQILGGQWPPIHKASSIDYYITGYAENALLALLKVLVGSEPMNSLKFDPKYFGNKWKVLSGNTMYPSYPMRSLMIEYEDRDFLIPAEWLTTEFSRGCKFSCPYCTFPILGVKGDYTRDADDAYQQFLKTYEKYGIENYYVADETFNDRPEKIVKFAEVIEKLPWKPFFSGFIRGDLMVSRGRSEWEQLERMGFLGHFYGIETMNAQTAKAIKKGMDPDRLAQGLVDAKNYFKSHGRKLYRGSIGLVVGLPHETKDSITKAFRWLENNWEGEGMMISPLEIPTDPTTDVLSQMSINYREYGYREYTGTAFYEAQDFSVDYGHMNSLLIWENDHMNYWEALELSDKFKLGNDQRRHFGMSMFVIDYLMHAGLSIEQALAFRKTPVTKEIRNNPSFLAGQKKFIDSYINKKLSL